MTDLESKVFTEFCKHDFDWITAHIPYPSTLIRQTIELTTWQCRTILESLKMNGYIQSATLSYWDEDGHHMHRGYELTDKARTTDIYKEIEEAENKLLRQLATN